METLLSRVFQEVAVWRPFFGQRCTSMRTNSVSGARNLLATARDILMSPIAPRVFVFRSASACNTKHFSFFKLFTMLFSK